MKSIFYLLVLLMSINLMAAEAPRITSSLSYQELQKLKASTPADMDMLGYSVAIDGDTAVVGADGFNNNTGEAYIYKYDEVSKLFLQKAVLSSTNLSSGDHFGNSVAISGDTVIIGAFGDDEKNSDSGAAYIYEKPSSGWADTNTEKAKLKASDADSDDLFGANVAISGDTVLIGAYFDNETNTDSGAAYIYEKPSSGWADSAVEKAKLKASDADSSDLFGASVSISGDTVIIGAYLDNETNDGSGAAYIYEKPSSGWADTNTEKAKLKASDPDEGDNFGISVTICGDTVIIGAYDDDETNNDSGAAYIYEKPSSGWVDTNTEKVKLKASDADEGDNFGVSVAISGDTVIIGAYNDNETNDGSGAAYLFTNALTQNTLENKTDIMQIEASDADADDFTFSLDGGDDVSLFTLSSTGLLGFQTAKDYENPVDVNGDNIYEVQIKLTDQSNLTRSYKSFIRVSDMVYEGESLKAYTLKELQKLKASTPASGALLGHSVAIDGDTAVVGAYGFDANTGRAYIYQYDEASKLFLQKAVLTSTNISSGDYFGNSVAISGDTVIIGAYSDDETNTNSGAAYIYEKPSSGWADTNTEKAKFKAYDADSGDLFGVSVAVSGDIVLVGANSDDETNSDSGTAYIYEKPLTGWADTDTEKAKLKASDADCSDNFGVSVAISGDTVIIGADGDDETNTDSGAAYIYEKPLTGWADTDTEKAKLKASDADSGDAFGNSVTISGDTVLIGAYLDDETNSDSGAAYIYEKPSSGWADSAKEKAKLKASDADSSDLFGVSVAISGDTVIIGAHFDSETSGDSGAVYIAKSRGALSNAAIIMYLLQ